MSPSRRSERRPRTRRGERGRPFDEICAPFLRGMPLPPADPEGGKESRGAVLVIGGAPEMPGAAILSATAALRAGAGKLQIATVRSVAPFVGAQVPEALVLGLPETKAGGIAPSAARALAERAEAARSVLIGPGMVDPAATVALVAALLGRLTGPAVVLDAGALEVARRAPRALAGTRARVAVTPHALEMASMLALAPAAIQRDPAAVARSAARALQVVVALKGAQTFIAAPSGRLLCNRQAGNAGLGTSGSGDTLSGLIAGLAARGAPLLEAAAWGVYLHGCAGDVLARKVGPLGFLARELLAEVPRLMAQLAGPGGRRGRRPGRR